MKMIATLFTALLWGCVSAPDPEISIYERARGSGVRIMNSVNESGSGIAISPTRILTAAHVVKSRAEYIMALSDRTITEFRTETIGDDDVMNRDFAILETESPVPHHSMIRCSSPNLGERVFTVSSPGGAFNVLTFGRVSSYAQTSDGVTVTALDLQIGLGSSGGGVLDDEGRVVGVMTSLVSLTTRGPVVTLMIPVSDIPGLCPDQIEESWKREGLISRLDPFRVRDAESSARLIRYMTH